MKYIGYQFKMDDDGVLMSNGDGRSQIMIEQTPYNIGDQFVLTLTENGSMLFKKYYDNKE
jgi:hypothetical protein|tara:strand:- start:835 stop:1014 length:180 start_codon:yes stop_codon:yes gene_type:complete